MARHAFAYLVEVILTVEVNEEDEEDETFLEELTRLKVEAKKALDTLGIKIVSWDHQY